MLPIDHISHASLGKLSSDPAVDSAIVRAYELHHQTAHGNITKHYQYPSEAEWNLDKKKILECLVPIHESHLSHSYRPVDGEDDAPVDFHQQKYDPLHADYRIPPVAYHTPETPSPAIIHPFSSSSAAGTPRNQMVPAEDRSGTHQHNIEPALFSPAASTTSQVPRRRRSSSSMHNEPPGKRGKGPQEHFCHKCNRVFPFKSKLDDHMKTHSTEKARQCPKCDKRFKREREVHAHLKSVHKVEMAQTQAQPSPAPWVAGTSPPFALPVLQLPPPPPPPPPLQPRRMFSSAHLPLPSLFDRQNVSSAEAAPTPAYSPAHTPDYNYSSFGHPTPAESELHYDNEPPAPQYPPQYNLGSYHGEETRMETKEPGEIMGSVNLPSRVEIDRASKTNTTNANTHPSPIVENPRVDNLQSIHKIIYPVQQGLDEGEPIKLAPIRDDLDIPDPVEPSLPPPLQPHPLPPPSVPLKRDPSVEPPLTPIDRVSTDPPDSDKSDSPDIYLRWEHSMLFGLDDPACKLHQKPL